MAITMTITEYKKFLEQKIKEAKSIEEKIDGEIVERFQKDLKKAVNKAIDTFYHSYSPKYYKRKYSLRYMYKITSGKNRITIDCDPGYTFAKHRMSNDDLYNLVFREGYHGGVPDGINHPSPGIPYWRTPHPHFTEWGIPAIQTESPLQMIKQNIKTYEETMDAVLDEVITIEMEKWLG